MKNTKIDEPLQPPAPHRGVQHPQPRQLRLPDQQHPQRRVRDVQHHARRGPGQPGHLAGRPARLPVGAEAAVLESRSFVAGSRRGDHRGGASLPAPRTRPATLLLSRMRLSVVPLHRRSPSPRPVRGRARCGRGPSQRRPRHPRHDARRPHGVPGLDARPDAGAGRARAAQGIVFEQAFAQAPITTVSHATILSGTYPQSHRVNDFGVPLPASVPWLPDAAGQGAGYHTAAFVGSLILDPRSGLAPGFDRGFDVYDAGFRTKRGKEDRYATMERRGRGGDDAGARLARPAAAGPVPALGPPLRRPRSLRGARAVPHALREGALRRRDRLRGRAGGAPRRGLRAQAPSSTPPPSRCSRTTARAWASTASPRTACSSTTPPSACPCC